MRIEAGSAVLKPPMGKGEIERGREGEGDLIAEAKLELVELRLDVKVGD